MFHFSRDHHVCQPLPVPENVQVYMTFDWGFGAPYSCGWWWAGNDGRLYRFGEFYGWNGQPDEGIRHTDSEIVEAIINREVELGLRNRGDTWLAKTPKRKILRIAGHDCWNKKPDYKGGGQGPNTIEILAKYGWYFTKGDPNRTLKIRQFHERLRIKDDGPPMVQIYDTCIHFIRTIPLLQADSKNIEDIDTSLEDHVYDVACHIFMARPITPRIKPRKKSSLEKRIERLLKPKGFDDYEPYAHYHQKQAFRDLGISTVDFGVDRYEETEKSDTDNGMLIPTIGGSS